MKINIFTNKIFTNENFPFLLFLIIFGTFFQFILLPSINVKSESLTYLHYNFIKVNIKGDENLLNNRNIKAYVLKNGEKITTIGGQDNINLSFDLKDRIWKGKFPVPWGAEENVYSIKLFQDDRPIGWEDIFFIKTRVPSVKFNGPLKILNLESLKRLRSYKIRNPYGEKVGYRGIFEWVKYIGANTIWYIAGQTASYRKNDLKEEYPWVKDNLETLNKFSQEANKENINFGAWISCFRIFGNKRLKPDWYSYSYKYKKSRIVETDGISILDKKRMEDIVKLAQTLNETESINYIGLDYIRAAGGGLELVNEFVQAMEVETPQGWSELSKMQRMEWLGRIVTRSHNRKVPLIDKWNWWRAQRVAKIISLLKKRVDFKKPLWAFVLSWELGHQHGQDPIMFQDAGCDLIAVMMYETDARRFDHIIDEWKKYLKDFKINLAMGNQIDWVLHQYSVYPSGPEEYARRMETSADYMKDIGNLKGLFIQDFTRAMWGRKGPYSAMEWLAAGARSFNKLSFNPALEININLPEKVNTKGKITGILQLRNLTEDNLENIIIDFPRVEGVRILNDINKIAVLNQGKNKAIPLNLEVSNQLGKRMGRYMISARAQYNQDVFNDFKYFWITGESLDNGSKYR